jgi:hypothetical protein
VHCGSGLPATAGGTDLDVALAETSADAIV